MIHHDLIFIILMLEWWLGAQRWINAKSIISLMFLILGTVAYLFLRRKNGTRQEIE